MRFIIRWSVTLGLVGSALLGNLLWLDIPAFALSQQQVKEKLDPIPVYLITNRQGLPLSRAVSDEKNGKKGASITGVYMSREEAQSFIDQLKSLKTKDTKLEAIVENLQVSTVSLGYLYQQLEKTKSDPNRLLFDFKPVKKEVDLALDLLHQSGEKVDEFRSIPIFAVRFGKDKAYVPIQVLPNKKQYIPLFFSETDAKTLLDQVKPKFDKAYIQVVDVDGVIKTFQDHNEDWLKDVVLVPSPESRAYIKSLSDSVTSKGSTGKTPSSAGTPEGNTGNSTSVNTK